jgi:hypothetical protein
MLRSAVARMSRYTMSVLTFLVASISGVSLSRPEQRRANQSGNTHVEGEAAVGQGELKLEAHL